MYKLAPILVLNNISSDYIPRKELAKYEPSTTSRKIIMAQYWIDEMNKYRFEDSI